MSRMSLNEEEGKDRGQSTLRHTISRVRSSLTHLFIFIILFRGPMQAVPLFPACEPKPNTSHTVSPRFSPPPRFRDASRLTDRSTNTALSYIIVTPLTLQSSQSLLN